MKTIVFLLLILVTGSLYASTAETTANIVAKNFFTTSVMTNESNSVAITSNDNCSNATLLTSSPTPNYLLNQTVNNATASGKPKATCDKYTGTSALADVWYYFMATASTHTIYVDPNGSQLDVVIVAYNSCSSTTEINSSDVTGGNGVFSSLTLTGLTVGNYYYIRLYDYGTQTTDGGFKICVTGENTVVTNCAITSITPTSETHGSARYSTTPGSDDIYFNSQPYCSFTVTSDCSWLTLSPMSGTTNKNGQGFINYTIQENTSTVSRLTVFYINGNPVTIKQNGKEYDDFSVKNPTISTTTIIAGTSVNVTCSHCYDGTSVAAELSNLKFAYIISKNNTYEPSEDIILKRDVSTIGIDIPSITKSTSLLIPTNFATGVYYILFVSDPENLFTESNENNNLAYLQVNVINTTDIPETSNSKNFHIYPNPVFGILNIDVSELNSNSRFEILNLTGQVFYNGKLTTKTVVHTSNFPAGVYVLKLENGNTVETQKIVIK